MSFETPDVPQYAPWPEVPEGTPLVLTHAARIEYEPETDRYGGEEGVRVAERFFEISSDATYALLLRTSRTERSSRLGKGLLAMVQLVYVFTEDREAAVKWATQYNLGYLRGVGRGGAARGVAGRVRQRLQQPVGNAGRLRGGGVEPHGRGRLALDALDLLPRRAAGGARPLP